MFNSLKQKSNTEAKNKEEMVTAAVINLKTQEVAWIMKTRGEKKTNQQELAKKHKDNGDEICDSSCV